MSTRTRAQQRSTTSSRRFGRPGATPQGRRSTAARGRTVQVSRRRQSSSKGSGLQALTGMLAGKKASSGAGKGAKAGAGMAMLTAAAGLAFKNRDRLGSMLKRGGGSQRSDATTSGMSQPMSAGTSMDATPPPMSAMDSPGTGLGTSASSLDPTTPSTLDPPATGLGGVASPSPLDAPGSPDPLDPTGTEPPADPTGSPSPFDPDGPPPADGSSDQPR